MRVSNAMIYVVTANAHASKWMPWQGHGRVTQFYDAVAVKLGEYLGQAPKIFMDTGLERDAGAGCFPPM